MKLLLVILQLSLVLCAKFLAPEKTLTDTNLIEDEDSSSTDTDAETDAETDKDTVEEDEKNLETAPAGGDETVDVDEKLMLMQADADSDPDADFDSDEQMESDSDEMEDTEEPQKMMEENMDMEGDMVDLAALNNTFLEDALKETFVKTISGVGKVLIKKEEGVQWVLLMKLSKNNFCYGSHRWTDGRAYHPHVMLDTQFPNHQQYDGKSLAFHRLKGIDAVKLQTNTINFKEAPEVYFKYSDTAERLMTTNYVDIIGTGGFNSKQYWNKWSKAYSNSRNRAPAFMRAGEFVRNPAPECRTNPQDRPSGCGKKCMFCMQAGDGHGCPTKSAHNDISKGIGLNRHYCGGGNGHDCSSSGNWAGDRRTLVWGRLQPGYRSTHTVYTMDYGGDVLVREEGTESWALVMKLAKNDFCHGSPRWTDGKAFKPEKMFDDNFPGHQEYDSKSVGFHKLEGITAVKIQTNTKSFKDAVVIEFETPGTPEKLMTTNDIKIKATGGFNTHDFWKKWENQYGRSRQRAPAFMRAGEFVEDPAPQCRQEPLKLSGCGKACVFCMQASDGHGCPARPAHNDISVGIGLSASFCGGGNRHDCSSSGNWVGDRTTLVWAKWTCEPHKTGQCQGTRHMGVCGELELDDCDTHYVHVMTDENEGRGAFLQCKTVDAQCVATGPACYGSCANARVKF